MAARLRPIDERGVVHESFLQALVVASPLTASADKTDIDNNGTTLGIHPPGRPKS
jgi:hypothetical protein